MRRAAVLSRWSWGDVLETAGFVRRAPHPTDRRARLVTLTARGKDLGAAWGTDRNREFSQVFAGLPDAELAIFDKVLEQVLTNLRTGVHRS
jgi:DNA-binding MarR family transcriptional regulator